MRHARENREDPTSRSFRLFRLRRHAAALALVALLPAPLRLGADEFSLIADSTVLGQNDGVPSGEPGAPLPAAGQLELGVETAFFFKNLELAGFPDGTIDGETFFGFLAPLRLRYRAHEHVQLELGALVGQNFGDDRDLDATDPLLRLAAEPLRGLHLVAGTIFPTHRTHDALRDDVQVFRDGAEQGLQVRGDWRPLKQDTWINWRVREGGSRPEEFEVGHTTQLRWAGLRLDGQVFWAHVGGQKNGSGRVENNLGTLAGGSYGFSPHPSLPDIRLGAYHLIAVDATRAREESGSGVEARLSVDLKPVEQVFLRLFAAHYHGDPLPARRGDPLYSLEDYSQAGAAAIFTLPAGLRLETSFTAQIGDGNFANTYFMNLVWGRNLPLWRQAGAEAHTSQP